MNGVSLQEETHSSENKVESTSPVLKSLLVENRPLQQTRTHSSEAVRHHHRDPRPQARRFAPYQPSGPTKATSTSESDQVDIPVLAPVEKPSEPAACASSGPASRASVLSPSTGVSDLGVTPRVEENLQPLISAQDIPVDPRHQITSDCPVEAFLSSFTSYRTILEVSEGREIPVSDDEEDAVTEAPTRPSERPTAMDVLEMQEAIESTSIIEVFSERLPLLFAPPSPGATSEFQAPVFGDSTIENQACVEDIQPPAWSPVISSEPLPIGTTIEPLVLDIGAFQEDAVDLLQPDCSTILQPVVFPGIIPFEFAPYAQQTSETWAETISTLPCDDRVEELEQGVPMDMEEDVWWYDVKGDDRMDVDDWVMGEPEVCDDLIRFGSF